jgi:DNA-binding CsgD family transcriptional regulator
MTVMVSPAGVEDADPPDGLRDERVALRGRDHERAVLDGLLAGAREGRSGALVLRGEAGVGKTALLEHLVDAASGMRVVRAVGVESEMELPFAALHPLLGPLLDGMERLPRLQRDALRTVFGLGDGPVPDRSLVGLAVLGLVAETTDERPLLCVVDDAQWLDRASAQALAFAARRLQAESIVIGFATREPVADLDGLPELVLAGLDDADARALLQSVVRGPMDRRILDRMVAESGGNPLALLELTRAQLDGGFATPGTTSTPSRIEDLFRQRIAGLPDEARLLLLVAAAEPVGDPALLWDACARLGIGREALGAAEDAGLAAATGAGLRLRHPLVRSAVYGGAPADDRRRVHAALAEASDPDADRDRRAWHRAQATVVPDEAVAVELERSAIRAKAVGGHAAEAAFLARAVGLTPDPARRAGRAVAAAQAKFLAGASDEASSLLAVAEASGPDEAARAHADTLRAQIAYAQDPGGESPSLLLAAARRLEGVDARLARTTYLDALAAAVFTGGPGVAEIAAAALAAPPAEAGTARPTDLLLDGVAIQQGVGFVESVPTLQRALAAFRAPWVLGEEALRCTWFVGGTASAVWDDEAWSVLTDRYVTLARAAGALPILQLALSARITYNTLSGRLGAAASTVEELRAVTEAMGGHLPPYGSLVMMAWRGRESDATVALETATRGGAGHDEQLGLAAAQFAIALMHNSRGRHEEALAAAEHAAGYRPSPSLENWGLVELVEAAARSGRPGRAAEALDRLTARTQASGGDWALGVEARSRALLSEGETADALYREAVERLGRTRVRLELARAQLLYGEWLRRERRRADARQQLAAAHDVLEATGAEALAQRARRELLATGETVRRRTSATRDELTAQEREIAYLAREGLSNPEIGARLFISRRTVQYHLRKVFTKLDITSRVELHRVLPPVDPAHDPR